MVSRQISLRKFPSIYESHPFLRILNAHRPKGSMVPSMEYREIRELTTLITYSGWDNLLVLLPSRLTVYVSRVMCLRVIFHSNFGKMSIMLAHREFVSQFEISLSNVPLTFNKIKISYVKAFVKFMLLIIALQIFIKNIFILRIFYYFK